MKKGAKFAKTPIFVPALIVSKVAAVNVHLRKYELAVFGTVMVLRVPLLWSMETFAEPSAICQPDAWVMALAGVAI